MLEENQEKSRNPLTPKCETKMFPIMPPMFYPTLNPVEQASSVLAAPAPIQEWLSQLPSQNVGTLYATIKDPITHIGIEYKVDGWGQLCDGRDHKDMVHLMLYNSFPLHGKGFTYVSWRAEPDNPKQNTYPRTGKVENPKPYSGVAYD